MIAGRVTQGRSAVGAALCGQVLLRSALLITLDLPQLAGVGAANGLAQGVAGHEMLVSLMK